MSPAVEYLVVGPDGRVKMSTTHKECLPEGRQRKEMEAAGYRFVKRAPGQGDECSPAGRRICGMFRAGLCDGTIKQGDPQCRKLNPAGKEG